MKIQRISLIAAIIGGVILIWMAMVLPTATHIAAAPITIPISGAASDAAIANEQSSSLGHTVGITFTPAFTSYLPILSNFIPGTHAGIYGKVTYQGSAVGGIELTLYRCNYNGTYWSCPGAQAQYTSTLADGSYQFTTAATLGSNQKYRVFLANGGGNPNYVSTWSAPDILAYTAGQVVMGGSFDIANTPLLSPTDAVTTGLPVVFHWTPRAATPSDSYRIIMFNPADESTWQSPALGYVDSYTLNSLPSGLTTGVSYVWNIAIQTSNGTGDSQEFRHVTFANISQK